MRAAARAATKADLGVVAAWIHSDDECRLWAGPAVSFPFRPGTLASEIGFDEAENLAIDDETGPAAFGQVVLMPGGRAHLARVIVRPDARGRGLGRLLLGALIARARSLDARVVSLNVYRENETARRVYEAAGFAPAPWPDRDTGAPPGILHLTLDLQPSGSREEVNGLASDDV